MKIDITKLQNPTVEIEIRGEARSADPVTIMASMNGGLSEQLKAIRAAFNLTPEDLSDGQCFALIAQVTQVFTELEASKKMLALSPK